MYVWLDLDVSLMVLCFKAKWGRKVKGQGHEHTKYSQNRWRHRRLLQLSLRSFVLEIILNKRFAQYFYLLGKFFYGMFFLLTVNPTAATTILLRRHFIIVS